MASSPAFLAEVLIGGVFSGLLYSLVALGFVLIFKASGVFNFAQGVMVLFAALTLVGLFERGMPLAVALLLTALVMTALAFAIERVVLRPLVNQAQIILFMATIGLNFFLEGFGQFLWADGARPGRRRRCGNSRPLQQRPPKNQFRRATTAAHHAGRWPFQ